MIILKFFLYLSKDEQKKRFLERINDPSKNWKFSSADLKERQYWDDYQKAYEDMLSNTSTNHAPWFVIPADDKWFTRLCVSEIICEEFEKLNLQYPVLSDEQKKDLAASKQLLLKEKKS
jgi:polyphosphate kinase 2 (PPK2 family)